MQLKKCQKSKSLIKKVLKIFKWKEIFLHHYIHRNIYFYILLHFLLFSFIVNLVYAFQDHDYLYLVMDFLSGGNLRYHLSHKKRFNEEQTSIQLYI